MSPFIQSITLEDRLLNVFIFRRQNNRHRHCAKHFLNLSESWHALENVTASAHEILTWRRYLWQLKCEVGFHSQEDCLNFPQCDKLLQDYSVVYCDKIVDVLCETVESGAVAVYSNGMNHLYLSSDGVIVITHKFGPDDETRCNVVTAYVPYENRIKTVTEHTVYERFFTALDKALRVVMRQGGSHRLIDKELWDKYKAMLLVYGDAQ
ncbi:MAG: hypothetical protein WBM02_10790 [bacterium]